MMPRLTDVLVQEAGAVATSPRDEGMRVLEAALLLEDALDVTLPASVLREAAHAPDGLAVLVRAVGGR
ncbi:hypothetical protein [Microbacterium aurum]